MNFVIVGAGGLGRECLDTALAAGVAVDGFADHGMVGVELRGVRVLDPGGLTGVGYVIGIADPSARRRIGDALDAAGCTARVLAHPTAIIAPETQVGPGVVILGGAYVSSSVVVGRHSQVQYNATVGHDSRLGDRVTVLPGANVSGSVLIEDDATVGSGAVILQGRRVGAGAFVGAGAVVTRDVAPGAVVVGSPARQLER